MVRKVDGRGRQGVQGEERLCNLRCGYRKSVGLRKVGPESDSVTVHENGLVRYRVQGRRRKAAFHEPLHKLDSPPDVASWCTAASDFHDD
ncbi:hypothetical protein GCM10010349_75580 [Streptomyces flavofungini]|nr:hypothetical protein GCM10010349_75580 [Streptomyces flavofungini]